MSSSLSEALASSSFRTDEYFLTPHCPKDYEQGRAAFIQAAKECYLTSHMESIVITARGPSNSELSIDVAVMGDLKTATNLLFHISGTHGVEAFAGSGIQHEFLTTPPKYIPSDTAIVFVHCLNPFGMAFNRRVNEDNIDLNRNFTDERTTPEAYDKLDPMINPKVPVPFSQEAFLAVCQEVGGYPAAKKALAEGQYTYPEGLFYGGTQEAEGPQKVIDWLKVTLEDLNREWNDVSIGVLDVHTGLGEHGVDTLLTPEAPTEDMTNFFGEKMSEAMRTATTGYKPKGLFVVRLREELQKITKCAQERFFVIAQEFGTIPEPQVIMALYDESAEFHDAKRNGKEYDPNGPGGQVMLRAFNPDSDEWRHKVVLQGRHLIEQSSDFFGMLRV